MLARSSLVVLVLLFAACSEPPPEALPEVARPVKFHTFEGDAGELVLSYAGTIAAAQSSEMGFEVPGRITELLVVSGQKVEQGEVLARIDDTDYRAALDQARADADRAATEYTRYQLAFEGNAVTKQELDLKRRNADVAEAALEVAQKGLDDTTLRALFTGEVARVLISDFANVQAKQPVLVLQDDSSLEIEVTVPEQDWTRAHPELDMAERAAGVRPRVELPALPGRAFPAVFTEGTTTADPVTRTYSATFAFDRPENVIVRPGMTGRIVLTVPERFAIADSADLGKTIPAAAVAADDSGAAYVWLIGEDMSVTRRAVTVGELSGDEIVLLDGLRPGDRIAASGVHNLREGMTVREFGG